MKNYPRGQDPCRVELIRYEVLFYNQACFFLIRNEADPEVLAESDPAPHERNEAGPEVLAPRDETEADSLENKEELGIPKFLDRLENVAQHYFSR